MQNYQPVRTTFKNLFVSIGTLSLLQACIMVQPAAEKPIRIDGSSTVYPITELIAKEFNSQRQTPVEVEVAFSGTIGGFEKFCEGKADINNASLPIPKRAMDKCKANGIAYIELPIAFDALTVVIHKNNNWTETMAVEELKTIWQPSAQGNITQWNQVNPKWPNQTLNLFGPGKDSGTFEYFTTVIVGEKGASRQDYVYSEDDEALVNGVSQDPNALGYFGYAYYEQHQDKLKAVGIDNGTGAVFPSVETVKNSSYQPLARPLFLYVNAKQAQENPSLAKFVEFYLDKASAVVGQVGYVPLPDSAYHLANIHFEKNQVGTVFGGKPVINVSINELLNQTYAEEGKEGYVF
jgi:phosphate transport system substrate-binding protein